jgi:F0F1-type ATP synthase membrane subunit b/b'
MRDIAHEENMKLESELNKAKSKKQSMKDRIAEIQAEIAKSQYYVSQIRSENNQL